MSSQLSPVSPIVLYFLTLDAVTTGSPPDLRNGKWVEMSLDGFGWVRLSSDESGWAGMCCDELG